MTTNDQPSPDHTTQTPSSAPASSTGPDQGWQHVGNIVGDIQLRRPCLSQFNLHGVKFGQCDLEDGHDGWHEHESEGRRTTWRPDGNAATNEVTPAAGA